MPSKEELERAIKEEKEQERKEAESLQNEQVQEVSAFTKEQLLSVWQNYLSVTDLKPVAKQLLSSDIELGENFVVYLMTDNYPFASSHIESYKPHVLSFLRKRLSNSKIDIVVKEIPKEQQKQVLYTETDRFKHLLEKYPALKTLREKLGLEVG